MSDGIPFFYIFFYSRVELIKHIEEKGCVDEWLVRSECGRVPSPRAVPGYSGNACFTALCDIALTESAARAYLISSFIKANLIVPAERLESFDKTPFTTPFPLLKSVQLATPNGPVATSNPQPHADQPADHQPAVHSTADQPTN